MISACQKFDISQRKACRLLSISRSAQRYIPKQSNDEEALREDIINLASKYGRYGYRRITALLKADGWCVNHKRVERIWREEGLKVPKKQKKRGRLYFNDGSCIRLKPLYPNHVWSYDFVSDRLSNGKKMGLKMNFIRKRTLLLWAYTYITHNISYGNKSCFIE